MPPHSKPYSRTVNPSLQCKVSNEALTTKQGHSMVLSPQHPLQAQTLHPVFIRGGGLREQCIAKATNLRPHTKCQTATPALITLTVPLFNWGGGQFGESHLTSYRPRWSQLFPANVDVRVLLKPEGTPSPGGIQPTTLGILCPSNPPQPLHARTAKLAGHPWVFRSAMIHCPDYSDTHFGL